MIDIKRGECGCCYGKYSLNKNKTLKQHGFVRTWYGGKVISKPCAGSGKLPVQYSDITLDIAINHFKKCLEVAKQKNDNDLILACNETVEKKINELRKWNLKLPLKVA
jgi:hypothetical protein